MSDITSDSGAQGGTRTVALVGSPNAGKTTLFNALTGSSARIGNYAGVTVERREGKDGRFSRRRGLDDVGRRRTPESERPFLDSAPLFSK